MKRALLGSAGFKAANAGLGFAVSIVLARALGAEGYGIYSTGFVLASVCAIIVQFGLPNLLMRETAAAAVGGEWGRMAAVWCWATRAALGLSVGVVLLGSFAVAVLADRLSSEEVWTYMLAFALVPLLAFSSLWAGALRGLWHIVPSQLPEMLIKPGVMLLLALTLGLAVPASATVALIMQIVAVSAACLSGAALLYRLRPRQLHRRRSGAPKSSQQLWKASATMAFAAGMNQINNHADLLLLSIFRSPEEVGTYRIAFQVALVCSFGLQIASIVISPYFVRLYKKKKHDDLQNLVTNAAFLSTVIALAMALPWFLFGEILITLLFGSGFVESVIVAKILIAGQILNASFGPVGMLLNMTGMERYVACFMAFAAILNITLNILWIPAYGSVGAAAATFLTFGAWNVGLFWVARARLGLSSHILAFSKNN